MDQLVTVTQVNFNRSGLVPCTLCTLRRKLIKMWNMKKFHERYDLNGTWLLVVWHLPWRNFLKLKCNAKCRRIIQYSYFCGLFCFYQLSSLCDLMAIQGKIRLCITTGFIAGNSNQIGCHNKISLWPRLAQNYSRPWKRQVQPVWQENN